VSVSSPTSGDDIPAASPAAGESPAAETAGEDTSSNPTTVTSGVTPEDPAAEAGSTSNLNELEVNVKKQLDNLTPEAKSLLLKELMTDKSLVSSVKPFKRFTEATGGSQTQPASPSLELGPKPQVLPDVQRPSPVSKGGLSLAKRLEDGRVIWTPGTHPGRSDPSKVNELIVYLSRDAQATSEAGPGRTNLKTIPTGYSLAELTQVANLIEANLQVRKRYSVKMNEYLKALRGREKALRSDFNDKSDVKTSDLRSS